MRKKTVTRRVVKQCEVARRGRHNQIEAVEINGRTKWEIGKTYAVQPARGKMQIARIRLVRIRSEHILRISTADAIAEGFSNRQHFLQVWAKIHGDVSLNCRVWVLEFELVGVLIDIPTLIEQKQGLNMH